MLQRLLQGRRAGYYAGRIGRLPVKLGRNKAVLQGQEAKYRLDGTGCAGGMPGEGLGGTYRRNFLCKNPFQSRALRSVVIGSARSVGIDIIYVARLKPGQLQSLLHSQESPFSVLGRSRLVESVAGISKAGKAGQGFHSPFPSTIGRFQHQIGSPFTQIKAGPRSINGPAGPPVQDHKGIEAVQMIVGEAFAASYHNPPVLSGAQQIGSEHHGIGGR